MYLFGLVASDNSVYLTEFILAVFQQNIQVQYIPYSTNIRGTITYAVFVINPYPRMFFHKLPAEQYR